MDQSKRMRVLKGFDNGTVNILVCTDVAARGLDIKGVSHVYNYDMATDAKDYIHRIGRTARAGESGVAINIITSRDYDNFANVQKHNPELKIEREMTPKFERIFVKFDEDKRRFSGRRQGNGSSPSKGRESSGHNSLRRISSGKSFTRNSRSGDSSSRRNQRSDGKKISGNFRRSSNNRDSSSRSGRKPTGSFRREQRGERNKRTNRFPAKRQSNFKRD
jgi:ATP-dependent RNA helicase DeaD